MFVGHETVDAMGRVQLRGNVIPHQWFHHVKFDNGKPDLVAIILLAEIVYWYRPMYVKDEATGQLITVKKRFKADLLQRSYDSFAVQFGLTKRQAMDAMRRLEEAGFVKRHFRTIYVNHTKVNNVLFIELLHDNVLAMTFERDRVDVSAEVVSPEAKLLSATERETNTENTLKTTNESTIKQSRRKRVYDEHSVHYELANMLYETILRDDPQYKKPNMDVWADHIRLMMERDGRTEAQIRYLIEWSQQHPFWKTTILSTEKLRKQSTTLIRQIQAQHEAQRQKVMRRSEKVPDWFEEHQAKRKNTPVVTESIDFEAERQKVLAKLQQGDKKL